MSGFLPGCLAADLQFGCAFENLLVFINDDDACNEALSDEVAEKCPCEPLKWESTRLSRLSRIMSNWWSCYSIGCFSRPVLVVLDSNLFSNKEGGELPWTDLVPCFRFEECLNAGVCFVEDLGCL